MNISPLQISRVSDSMQTSLTTSQLQTVQQQLLQVEQQISTGQQYTEPSDNLASTTIAMQLQRTLTQQQTYLGNLSSAQSQLGEVDNSLSSLTSLVQQAQTIASADVSTDVTQSQRTADAQTINSIYTQVLNLGNTTYNGLYLFGGDKNTSPPFVATNGGVQFDGSTSVLQNTVQDNTNIPIMVSSGDIFGADTGEVQGTSIEPNLTAQTRVSDLAGANGTGVQLGSIQISNGTTSAIVNLSNADTVGDVVNAINAAGVGGITAAINGQGISLNGSPADNITVNDVAGDSTADDLGILQTTPAGNGVPVIGVSAQANVTALTPLASLRQGAGIDPSGLTISNGAKTVNVSFAGLSTVGDMMNAIDASDTGVQAQINAAGTGINIVNTVQGTQMTVAENGGASGAELGVNSFSPQTPLSALNNGAGVGLASEGAADFQVTASNGQSFPVSLAGASTVQDAINKINAAATTAGVAVTAGFSNAVNGITLTDATGGAGTLGVTSLNASTAAADLGLTANPPAGNVLTGADVNPIVANGIFTDLANLQDALTSGNQAKITLAAQGLQTDYNNIVDARGAAGAQVQSMQNQTDQITSANTATQTFLSQLSDTDFTAAISKFTQLQTSLQATLEMSAQTLSISLLNFLG